jgi:hypothetical protein
LSPLKIQRIYSKNPLSGRRVLGRRLLAAPHQSPGLPAPLGEPLDGHTPLFARLYHSRSGTANPSKEQSLTRWRADPHKVQCDSGDYMIVAVANPDQRARKRL